MITFEDKVKLVVLALRLMNDSDPVRTDLIMLAIVKASGLLEALQEAESEAPLSDKVN